jgi:hypothetical protein
MGTNIESFVRESIKGIKKGLPKNFAFNENIEFEISVTATENANGGIDIKVFSGKMEGKSEVVQKIKFSVYDTKQADEAARQKVNDVLELGGSLVRGILEFNEMIKEEYKNKLIG